MDSAQRQNVIIAKMNELQKEYHMFQMIRKKIMKRKRKTVNASTKKKNVGSN